MNKVWHKYAPNQPFVRQAVVVWVSVAVVVLILEVLLTAATIPQLAWPLLIFSMPILAAIAAPLFGLAYATADLSTDEEGLAIEVMGVFTKRIEWAALRHTEIWDVEPPRHISILSLGQWESVHAVYIPGLRGMGVIGSVFGLGRMPVVIITPNHANADALLRRLKHMQHPMGRKKRGSLPRLD